ncbi:MAG: alcohol dehydrogenase catalytic domain-containing protein [Fimbriimonadaceae bacterium]|nr:alcohol dehydrogenase catalytic domain-containing protein [Fimbriimonadaceae bacterium]
MRALVVTGPEAWEWADLPLPRPAADEALVRIETCGFCNSTDRELIRGDQPYRPATPFILGHESVGTVVEVGAACQRYRVGDRVTRAAAILPGDQRDGLSSGWGGFAEYGLVRDAAGNYTSDRQVVLAPALAPEDAFLSISLAETRAFVEQVAEATGPLLGAAAVVVGTGVAGLTLTRWLRSAGCRLVVTLGRRPERLLLARRCGAHLALDSSAPDLAEQIRAHHGGALATHLFEAIGRPALLPSFAPLLQPDAVVAIYGAAAGSAWDAVYAQLPAGLRPLRPGPEEHRYTRLVSEDLLAGRLEAGFWRSHLWTPDEFGAAIAQIDAGQVIKGCVRFA